MSRDLRKRMIFPQNANWGGISAEGLLSMYYRSDMKCVESTYRKEGLVAQLGDETLWTA
jgi:hypothetical protein